MKILSLNIILLLLLNIPALAQQRYALVIDEIYADTTPSHGLPEAEYVELYNRSDQAVNLNRWSISDMHSTAMLPAGTLAPHQYSIVCNKSDAEKFTSYGKVIGLSDFPSLNNDGDEIILRDEQYRVIHSVDYKTGWYRDKQKANGGYSLEMISPDKPCSGSTNWKASAAAIGGTPGKINSINGVINDNQPLDLISAAVINNHKLQITFNKTLDSAAAVNPANYQLSDGLHSINAIAEPPFFRKVDLLLTKAMDSNQIYQVIVNNISSCNGSIIGIKNSSKFGIPKTIAPKDIILNEILFNPRSGGKDFLEIYNRSNKVLDLKDLIIARRYQGTIEQQQQVSESSRLLFPGKYMVITESAADIKSQYYCKNPDAFAEIDQIPVFPNTAGDVVLLNKQQEIVDEFSYNEKDHNALINNPKGISLEKINPAAATQNPANWQSAAADVGYATPTYQNSQFIADTSFKGGFTFSSTIISPDNDGLDDQLLINYQFPSGGFIATISIYNSNGFLVRRLYKNTLMGTSGRLKWDGYGEDHQKLEVGIYILYINIFNLKGEQRQWKKAITIARKF